PLPRRVDRAARLRRTLRRPDRHSHQLLSQEQAQPGGARGRHLSARLRRPALLLLSVRLRARHLQSVRHSRPGFMLLYGDVSAGLYALFALTPITYSTMLLAVILLTSSFLFVASAQNGLTSMIGQQHAISGQISAAWNIFLSLPALAAFLIGGYLSDL